MKLNVGILFALSQATAVFSAAASSAAAECGDLGVFNNDSSLAAVADMGALRKCLNHPVGHLANPEPQALEKRDCWYGKSVGCTKGYCWKTCGPNGAGGPWCWTAYNNGFGDWKTCSKDSDCSQSDACGQAVNGCKDCGCSC